MTVHIEVVLQPGTPTSAVQAALEQQGLTVGSASRTKLILNATAATEADAIRIALATPSVKSAARATPLASTDAP